MALGNDEQVDVGFRVDVLDCDVALGPVDDGGGELAADDLAEDAVGVGLRQRRSPLQ
jgi:hypothetical protein